MSISDDSPATILYDKDGNPAAELPGTSAAKALAVQGVTGGVPLAVDITIGDTVTTNQGTPNTDPNSWPVHQVGAPPLSSGAATEVTLATRATEATVSSILTQLDVALSTRASESTLFSGVSAILAALAPLATEPTLASILGQLDVALSTRASQATVAGILAQLDVALSTRASEATALAVLAQLDVALSTRASETTALAILGQLDVLLSSRASEVTVASILAGLATLATEGTLTSILAQLDVPLSTRAGETTLLSVLAQLDVALSTRASETTLVTANGHLASIDTDIDVALSTRASEVTLAAAAASVASIDTDIDVALSTRASQATVASILTQLDVALSTRASQVTVASILGQLDVALSTRASEATLALIKVKTDNLDVLLSTRAAAATQTDGTQKSIVRGGAKGATAAADLTSTAEGADHQGLDVQLYHGGAAKDPTAIRALTSADVVTAAQGAAAAAAAPWAQRLSDGAAFYDAAKTGQLPVALVGGRLDENLGAWLGSTAPTVGSKVSASSIPIVIASDQSNLPENLVQVGGAAVTTHAAGEQLVATEGRAATGAALVGNPVLSGGSDGASARSLLTDTSGRQQVVGAAADGAAFVGNPVLMGGQDGTNAQSLLTDTSGRPNVVGAAAQGAAVTGNPVLLAGEDASGNVSRLQERTAPPVGTVAGQVVRPVISQTSTTSTVVANAASVQLLAANTARIGAVITNDGNKTLYVKCGTTASLTDFAYLVTAGDRVIVDFGYTGRIDGIWDSANGNARIAEFT